MENKNQRVVIVGAGQAGAVAAQSLREAGFSGSVAMFGAELELPYERPELSKGYLAGKTDFENLQILSEQQLGALEIQFNLSQVVETIDPARMEVTTSAGGGAPYDHLILATGGSPRSHEACLSLRSRGDADMLQDRLRSAKSIGIIGAGWLGLELAAHSSEMGLETHVYELAHSLCARVLPKDVADHIQAAHTASGINFALGAAPDLEALKSQHDLVVACIGMIANDSLAQNAGLETDAGILVNEHQLTSAPNIYAIGDCARPRGETSIESWAYANRSARRAALTICGKDIGSEEPLWFWSKQGGLSLQMIGTWGEGLKLEQTATKGDGMIWSYHSGEGLEGLIAINSPRDFAKARRELAAR